jgi:hypothetical protein
MFSGPPLPLPPTLPHVRLLGHAQPPGSLGVWVRPSGRDLRIIGRIGGVGCRLLVSADLGFLLSRCSRVAVREGADPIILDAEMLIQWRALQVVTGTPYLPCMERLKEIFPEADLDAAGFQVPTRSCPPEEVLADCLTHGIPVAGSRIIYRAPTPHPATALGPEFQ